MILTFTRSFRLSRYVVRSDSATLHPGLIASTVTAIFVLIVDAIILVTGILAITLPTLWIVQRFTGVDIPIDRSMPATLRRSHTPETASDADPGTDPAADGRPLLDVVGHRRTIDTDQMIGTVGHSIVEFANGHDVDHIIIGSHGRTGASRILLGSIAENVARRSPVPVTIVR